MELYKEIKTHAFNKTWEVAELSNGTDRNAIVMTNGETFAVGKNFTVDSEGFTVWSWGTYDFKNVYDATACAEKWVNG